MLFPCPQPSAAAASQQHAARAQLVSQAAPQAPQAAPLSYDDYEDERQYYRAATAPPPAPAPAPVAPSAPSGPGPAPGPVYQAYLQYRRFQNARTPASADYYSTY